MAGDMNKWLDSGTAAEQEDGETSTLSTSKIPIVPYTSPPREGQHSWDNFFEGHPDDRLPRGSGTSDPDERVSHILARILRYHADNVGLSQNEDGYVPVTELLQLQELESLGTVAEDIRRVVATSIGTRGARFEVRDDAEGLAVRPVYKHPQGTFKEGRPMRNDGIRDGRPPRAAYRTQSRGFNRQVTYPDDRYGTAERPRNRPGFSRGEPPALVTEATQAAPAPAASVYKTDSSFASQDRTASASTAASAAAGAGATQAEDRTASASTAASAAAGAGATQAEEPDDGEVWEKYFEPETDRAWYWNEATEEIFYADDETSGWERFEDEDGKPWWWNEQAERHFFEKEEEE